MLYAQPADFNTPAEFAQSDMPVEPMDWNAYVSVRPLFTLYLINLISVCRIPTLETLLL